jgi:hypothetical protein
MSATTAPTTIPGLRRGAGDEGTARINPGPVASPALVLTTGGVIACALSVAPMAGSATGGPGCTFTRPAFATCAT